MLLNKNIAPVNLLPTPMAERLQRAANLTDPGVRAVAIDIATRLAKQEAPKLFK